MDWGNDGFDGLLGDALMSYEARRLPPSLHHLLLCTPKEIELKRLRAKARLIDGKTANVMREEINDVFYPMQSWPAYALRIVLTEDLGYNNRLSLATFLHGNGLRDQDLALRIFQHYNSKWRRDHEWERKFRKFHALFEFLDGAADPTNPKYYMMSQNYWFFSVNVGCTVFYNGNIRQINK